MILTVPISGHDVNLLPLVEKILLNDIENEHGFGFHRLIVVPAPSVAVEGKRFCESVGGSFESAEVVPLKSEPSFDPPWPRNCNQHFYETARIVNERHPDQPWYFFELDNTPVKYGWLDMLQQEYNAGGKPFCGKVHPTWRLRDGKFQREGSHMVGTGVYAGNLFTSSTMIDFIIAGVDPFDVALQGEIMDAWGCTDSKVIQHNWSSRHYRREGDEGIVCEMEDPGPYPPDIVHNKPIEKWTAIVHGCKDGSLARLILSDRGVEGIEAPLSEFERMVSMTRPVETSTKPELIGKVKLGDDDFVPSTPGDMKESPWLKLVGGNDWPDPATTMRLMEMLWDPKNANIKVATLSRRFKKEVGDEEFEKLSEKFTEKSKPKSK